jgi:hypothetical protein
LSVTQIGSSQKDFIFLSPERAATYQPRATPWVNGRLVFSPERALHKKSDKTCNALSGLKNLLDFYPGRCPGLVCCCPFRARKTISDFMRSVFYSPAILVTLISFTQGAALGWYV